MSDVHVSVENNACGNRGSTDTSGSTDNSMSSGNGIPRPTREKSSLFFESGRIIELKLRNISYCPATSTGSAVASTISFSKWKHHKSSGSSDNNRTTVLSNISTKISPFELTAWMGPSGSGKTSLASVVAGLVNPDDINGKILVNGDEGRLPKRYVGVVWQDDLLLENLTVEETIYFAARLKTPNNKTDTEVQTLVEEAMDELGLMHIRDNIIGSPVANRPGISGGERKRTSVAAEIVNQNSFLILDEPTSGLDATTAFALMTTLKDLTRNGHSIAVIIHQPRTDIFQMLDHLLLLSKGRVLYDGPANQARHYLESCPSVGKLPPETNTGDWIMDEIILDEKRIKKDSENKENNRGILADYWMSESTRRKQQSEANMESVRQQKRSLNRKFSSLLELRDTTKKFEAPFSRQFSLLLSRTLKQRRGEKFTTVAILLTFFYTCMTSYFWWRLPNTTAYIFPRNSIIFFFLIAQGNSIVVSSMTVFQQERALLRRERAKKMYGVLPYFLSKTVSDMTNNTLLPLAYGIVCYFTVGLRPEFGNFLKFVLGFFLTLNSAQSMGFFLSSLIPSIQMGLILAPPLTLFFFILGGFYIPLADMHVGVSWLTYLSFARYGYSALLVNEYGGREIPCSEDEVSVSIGDAGECPMIGDSVYEQLGIDGVFATFWFNILMIALLDISFRLGAYGLLRRQ